MKLNGTWFRRNTVHGISSLLRSIVYVGYGNGVRSPWRVFLRWLWHILIFQRSENCMVADLCHFQYVVFSLFWDKRRLVVFLFFVLSHCRLVVLSHCRFVALSSCRLVTLSSCRLVTLSSCRIVVLWASLFIYNYHLLILHNVLYITN